jgi:hydrogenase expression/formation protein HypC
MCVAMPGTVTSIGTSVPGAVMGLVEFGDRTLEVNLVMLPDVEIGDHILVHSGFAIRTVAEPYRGLHPDSERHVS